jgi:large subunit ribosomal protein L21e
MKRVGGTRRKTRSKFRKHTYDKGKISIRKILQVLNPGDKVKLLAETGIQHGLYHSRYFGKAGIVQNKRGKCYEVQIKDGNSKKILIVHPVHLRKTK